jgi:hypothetical protein
LPATADSVARYLVDHARTHSLNTLRQRLAGLAAWHLEQGFPDPTKAPHVKKVLKGIAKLHPAAEKRAKPIQLVQLTAITSHLDQQIAQQGSLALPLQPLRNKALMLIGFWRAFRSNELARLAVDHIRVEPGSGMEIYLPRTKGDRSEQGRYFKAPALNQLCPVEAYLEWISAAQITEGPVFNPWWITLGGERSTPRCATSMRLIRLSVCATTRSQMKSNRYLIIKTRWKHRHLPR